MPSNIDLPNNSLNITSAKNGLTNADSFSHLSTKISVNGSKHVSDAAVNCSSPGSSTAPARLSNQQTGLMSFFSARQRKASGQPPLSLVSVKQSRLMCIAKIDETIQAIDDLLDFHNRSVKAENKVSAALWHTIQYSKSRKFDGSDRTIKQQNPPTNDASNINPPVKAGASSSGDNSVVDSGISEMTTEMPSFCRTNGLHSSSASQAKQFLQCFVVVNESRAEIAACRAYFHRKITTHQLQMVLDALHRLRLFYIKSDTKLETYSSQLEADVRECWKKYAKYADNVTRLRLRLNSLLDKGLASKRKAIETSVNELDAATLKLHMIHNTYTLSLITARQYHQWLVTRLQPCLYCNLNRCLRLVDYAVSYLLRLTCTNQTPGGNFDFIALPDADSLMDTNIDLGLTGGAQDADVFRRAFPFDSDLLVRAGDESLQPDKIIVNPMTAYPVQKLLQHHLQEVANQGSITQVLENEHSKQVSFLSTWTSVLSSAGATLRNLPAALKTDETMTRLLSEVEKLNPLDVSSGMDEEKVFLGAATKPATLCDLAIELGTLEFFHCQSLCFADSHAQIVRVLRQSEVVAPLSPPSSSLLSSALPSTTPAINPVFEADVTCRGTGAVGSTSLDILESRFHCLRVQLDNQDGSISIGGRSSHNESDSENDAFFQHHQEEASHRRSVRVIEEEASHQTLTLFPKSTLTLTDNRSTNRHSALVGDKAMHRFQPNHFLQTEPSDVAAVSPVICDASIASRAGNNLAVNKDKRQIKGAHSGVAVDPIRHTSTDHEGATTSHRMDQDDVDINKEPWFHGVLPRTEVARLLQNQGDFLVRETSRAASTSYPPRRDRSQHRQRSTEASSINSPWSPSTSVASSTMTLPGSQSVDDLCADKISIGNGAVVTNMVLSVYWNAHKHFIIQGGDEVVEGSSDLGNRRGGWSFEDYEFPTLRDLIEYHMQTGKPVTQSSGAILLSAISRPDWQLDNKDVVLLEKIGQGNFGEVHRGFYNGREVAVKTCRAGPAEVEIRRKFLQGEATALNFFHPNVVRLLGIAVRSHPIMIVMEFVSGGSLLSFLRKNGKNADISLLLRMCVDAACGMAYLESKNCIHRDLAARNCLLTEDRVLKIADFGMAREEHVYESGQPAKLKEKKRYKKSKKLSDCNGPIPIKWTAPEALYLNRYTSKCDVWSFGVLLWEIFSCGDTPYHGLTNGETRDLVENGYRLSTPERMPRQLGKCMQSCWQHNPSRRPTFSSLVIGLTKLKRDFCEATGLPSPRDCDPAADATGIVSFKKLTKMSTMDREILRSRLSSSPVTTPSEIPVLPSALTSSSTTLVSRLPRLKPVMSTSEEASADAGKWEKISCDEGHF